MSAGSTNPCQSYAAVPARPRPGAVRRDRPAGDVRADRDAARRLVADVTVRRREDDVLRRHVEQRGRRPGCRRRPSATFIASTASMVRPGCRAVQPSATSNRRPGASVGDRRVADAHEVQHVGHDRAVHGLADRQPDVVAAVDLDDLGALGDRRRARRRAASCCSSTRSRKKSVTSAPRLVRPHASVALWPMTTPGMPANAKPETSYGHCAETSAQRSPTCSQMPGAEMPRCGSLASSGLPDSVRSPRDHPRVRADALAVAQQVRHGVERRVRRRHRRLEVRVVAGPAARRRGRLRAPRSSAGPPAVRIGG